MTPETKIKLKTTVVVVWGWVVAHPWPIVGFLVGGALGWML